jgi:hypothetical protein
MSVEDTPFAYGWILAAGESRDSVALSLSEVTSVWTR